MGRVKSNPIYDYYAFGLTIKSTLELPELLVNTTPEDHADVTIAWGDVSPEGLETPVVKYAFFQAQKDTLWLNIKDVGRFLISNGRKITIEPHDGVDCSTIRLFLLGSCMGGLLMQRGLFLLHGNAIRVGDHCVSFVGDSGAGKSTLSGAFFKRGYSILADDVCAINPDGVVSPSFPHIKLWLDSANKLKIKTDALRRIRPDVDKFAVPLAQQFHAKALPIRVVYCLNTSQSFDTQYVLGINKIKVLYQHTYRRHYLKGLMKENEYYMQCARMAQGMDVVNLMRPMHGFQLDQLVDYVELDLRHKGLL